jgi:hypothetical protein
MAKGQKHYFKDGKEFSGNTHKMSDGSLHTGLKHTKGSKVVVHLKDLSKTAQKKAGA